MIKISACFLNWRRPDNLKANLDRLRRHPLVDDCIVWNNNGGHVFQHDWPTVLNGSRDLGLHTRFAAAALLKHDCVLIFDDDLRLPPQTIDRLVEFWQQEPDLVHGIFGRRLKRDRSYGIDVNRKEAEVPIVLTRALVFHRKYAAAWLAAALRFEKILRDGSPVGNGEDILLSYVARKATGRLNRVHKLPSTELPPGPREVGIHSRGWGAHLTHRTRLCRFLEDWLKPTDDEKGNQP